MRNVTAASLVQQARIWTNTVGSKQPPDSDLLSLCNTSFAMWYEKIADATESDYWWEEYLFTTVSGVNNYLVPADQDRIRRVDSQVTQAPQNQRWVAVRRYDEAMKNIFVEVHTYQRYVSPMPCSTTLLGISLSRNKNRYPMDTSTLAAIGDTHCRSYHIRLKSLSVLSEICERAAKAMADVAQAGE